MYAAILRIVADEQASARSVPPPALLRQFASTRPLLFCHRVSGYPGALTDVLSGIRAGTLPEGVFHGFLHLISRPSYPPDHGEPIDNRLSQRVSQGC